MDEPSTPTPSEWERSRACLASRVQHIREELYGVHGAPLLASELRLTQRLWFDYERGAQIPAEVLLRFIDLTEADPHWLLTGEGHRFRRDRSGVSPPSADDSAGEY